MIPFNFSNTTTAARINASLGKKCIICEGSVIILYYYDMNSVDMRISSFFNETLLDTQGLDEDFEILLI